MLVQLLHPLHQLHLLLSYTGVSRVDAGATSKGHKEFLVAHFASVTRLLCYQRSKPDPGDKTARVHRDSRQWHVNNSIPAFASGNYLMMEAWLTLPSRCTEANSDEDWFTRSLFARVYLLREHVSHSRNDLGLGQLTNVVRHWRHHPPHHWSR